MPRLCSVSRCEAAASSPDMAPPHGPLCIGEGRLGWGGHDHPPRPQILQNASGQQGCGRREAASPIGPCSRGGSAAAKLVASLPDLRKFGCGVGERQALRPSAAIEDHASWRGALWALWCWHVHLGAAGRRTVHCHRLPMFDVLACWVHAADHADEQAVSALTPGQSFRYLN